METHNDITTKVADFLLEIKAVILKPENPFTWASGWKSPIYCDNRIILGFPHVRNFVENSFATLIKNNFHNAELIAGVATAGIAHAALIADRLDLPMCYVRPKPKDHGTGKLIEGKFESGQKTVVIEDLISTGKSSLQAIDGLKNEGANILGMMAIFTYGFPLSEESFNKENLKVITLTNYPKLIERAVILGYVSERDLKVLEEWRNNPGEWGK